MITKIKTVASTSKVDFQNISHSYYDMIISIQSSTINQTITMVDTEGINITEQPIVLTRSLKIIMKDQKIGSISFSDPNSYTIIISYSIKREAAGIPFIDFDYSTANTSVSHTAHLLAFNAATSGTANEITQLVAPLTPPIYDQITFLADSANTDPIFIGMSNGPTYPLAAGDSVNIKYTHFNLFYLQSAGVSQVLHCIGGGI
ncbi:MAG: hypothetical protein ACYDC6_14230 [Acidobacteriaceae bacterium]